MDDKWFRYDLPVLDAAAEYLDENPSLRPNGGDLARITGIDLVEVGKALTRLDSEYVRLSRAMGPAHASTVMELYPSAYRAVGAWPTPDSLADRIVAALEDAAANGETEEVRTRAQKMLEGVKGVGKGVLTGVLVKVMTGGL